jgi:3-hydroxybutyryl-CoA dehydrogenase
MKSLAIIGAGQMGQGIAQVAARAGIQVLLADADLELATRAKRVIERAVARQVEREKIGADDARALLERIAPSEIGRLTGDIGFAIEAIPEQLALKQRLFAQLDASLPAHAVLASNTSSVSITALGAVTKRPDRVIGMHFMNPVPVMELVEIVRGLATSDATLAQTRALAEQLGKRSVLAADSPGFVVNRILVPMLNEAIFALEGALASAEDIDLAMKLGTHQPMGPLALADLIGLDTVLAICESLHRELGDDKYRPAPLLRRYVAAGWLGKKSGRGFHSY